MRARAPKQTEFELLLLAYTRERDGLLKLQKSYQRLMADNKILRNQIFVLKGVKK